MKKLLLASVAAMSFASNAQAAELLLALGIDGSGSISSPNFALQRNAYANVLADTSVLPQNGSVAIAVYLFGSSVQTIFPLAEITASNISSLIDAVNGMVRPRGGTNIGGTIQTATADLLGSPITSNRQVIDISTDGMDSSTSNLITQRNAAIAAGIDQINCIGIGANANCSNVVGGIGAFSLNATTFDDFELALSNKIRTEVTGGVPEPATWAMMLLGFGAIGGAMRSRRQQAKVRFAF